MEEGNKFTVSGLVNLMIPYLMWIETISFVLGSAFLITQCTIENNDDSKIKEQELIFNTQLSNQGFLIEQRTLLYEGQSFEFNPTRSKTIGSPTSNMGITSSKEMFVTILYKGEVIEVIDSRDYKSNPLSKYKFNKYDKDYLFRITSKKDKNLITYLTKF